MREDQYNDFLNSRHQKRKAGLSKQQIDVLASIYDVNMKPTSYQRLQIAEKLGAEEDKIKNWFQNRRAKDKKRHREAGATIKNNKHLSVLKKIYPDCSDLYRRRQRQ